MPLRRSRPACRFAAVALALSASARIASADFTAVDLGPPPPDDIRVSKDEKTLTVSWPIVDGRRGSLVLSLNPDTPLIAKLATGDDDAESRAIISNVQPVGVVTVGSRDLKPAGWTVFFDNPRRRPYQAHALSIGRKSARVVTEGKRVSVVFDGARAGPFEGEYRFTIYPGSRLVRAAAVMSTDRPATAYLIDHGLSAPDELPWKSIAWTGLDDEIARADAGEDARQIQARSRTIIAEGRTGGSVAMVPPPHQYFYPLDEVDNLASVWTGRGYRGRVRDDAFGIRQTIEGDNRWVPWVNAPPETKQDMGVFYLLSDGDAARATADVLAYTRGDTFKPLDGYKTFSSHYHVEHTVNFLNRQRDEKTTGIPKGLETPEFISRFKALGLNAVHLAEFHLGDGDMKVADRLTRMKTLHAECARLSDDTLLLLPGEEPNVHLGGHWLSFFPKPVYWTLDRKKGQPFVEEDPAHGKVYHVGNADDVFALMEAEKGLMWTAHPRIKASTAFPDAYQDRAFFKSDRYLGGAWKAMPADYAQPRLGSRVLNLLDDMNNWGAHKQAPGEVDVFHIDNDSELYAHMNVNYLKLDRLPAFGDGWTPILDALRGGRFFTTTGEVLIPSFDVAGRASGDTLPESNGPLRVRASLEWTFPLAFAEVVSGDGKAVYRDRIDLSDTKPFGKRQIEVPVNLTGRKWVRFEVWDVAANGAYTQPVWIE